MLQPCKTILIVVFVLTKIDLLCIVSKRIVSAFASVAQLAERNHGKVEVSGSIPLGGLSVTGVPVISCSKEAVRWPVRKRQLSRLSRCSVVSASAKIIRHIRIVRIFRVNLN